jgi:hypothetical protein
MGPCWHAYDHPVSSRTWLAIAIAAWTLLSWGGRIRLLTDAEQGDLANWVRIGGSLIVGLAAAAVIFWAQGSGVERWVLTLFAAWSVALWARSLITVWGGDQSLAFKTVHTVLAAGFFVLALLALRVGWAPGD